MGSGIISSRSNIKISVITVVRNAVTSIDGTLNSVARQRYKEKEHIVIDGCSTDGTSEKLESYRPILDVLVRESDKGMYDAINKGLTHASGDVIGILNSDDVYVDEFVLNSVAEVFEKNPSADFVISGVRLVNHLESRMVREVSVDRWSLFLLRFGWMPPHPGMFVRRSVYERIGNFKLDYRIAADFEFAVRAFKKYKCTYVKLNQFTVLMADGGMSNKGINSKYVITQEIKKACGENQIFTSELALILRFPVKYWVEVVWPKLRNSLRSLDIKGLVSAIFGRGP